MISDAEHVTELSTTLKNTLLTIFENQAIKVQVYDVNNELSHCVGCFSCWIKTPGECAIKDAMNDINKEVIHSDIVLYLSPIVFGSCSSVIKNALDRSLPNVSPFFTRINGLTQHKRRYSNYPAYFMIGYGENLAENEKTTFLDWIQTHNISRKAYVCSTINDIPSIAAHFKEIHESGGNL
jgi:multimeric flavodoxin WrbA